jgi:hypothetical protein
MPLLPTLKTFNDILALNLDMTGGEAFEAFL